MNDYIISKWFAVMHGHVEDVDNLYVGEVSNHDLFQLKNALEDFDVISKGKGLAEFVDEKFKDEIESIVFESVGRSPGTNKDGSQAMVTSFRVDLNRRRLKHTDKELERYLNKFLLGQASDGWGEVFSQYSFDDENSLWFYPWTEDETYCVLDE